MAKDDKVIESAEFELPIMGVTELVKQLHAAGIPVYSILIRTHDFNQGIFQDITLDLEASSVDDDADLDPLDELDDTEQH